MTKAELMHALEPFDDDIEIVIGEGEHFYEITGDAYGIDKNGEGWAILDKGSQVSMPRMRTVRAMQR